MASRKCGAFSRAAFIRGRRLFEGGVYSARRTSTVSRHAPSAHVNFVLGLSHSHLCARWLTLSSSLPSSPFHQRFMAIMSTWTHLRMHITTVHMNVIKCGYCSRAATITLSSSSVRRLFEGSVYSGCGVYSRKYGIQVSSKGENL